MDPKKKTGLGFGPKSELSRGVGWQRAKTKKELATCLCAGALSGEPGPLGGRGPIRKESG